MLKNAPNILFILSDDHGCWAMGCAGNPEIKTPNLDKLAASGLLFDNFFCTSPVCSPARASLLTGRIPSQHGVHDWLRAGDTVAKYEPALDGQLVEYLKGQPGYTDALAAAGYSCGISGKWHLGDAHHPQKSLSFWRVHAKGGGPYYQAPMIKDGEVYEESHYVTDVITDNALKFLALQKERDAPFYLSVHYTAPHDPWGREHHPAELFDDYYQNCPFESVPAGLEPPEWADLLRLPVNDEKTRRTYLSGYFAAVTAMDDNIGRLIDWLERNGLRENTLIIFTSDNGMNMGHHGVYGKGNATLPVNMFEESIKVPFVVSQPGCIAEGERCSAMLSQYDFMPTLLDYLDLDNAKNESLPGKSFADILRGKPISGHDCLVVYDEYGPARMIRTEKWKYIHRYPDGPHELYDLINDPKETDNMYGRSMCRAQERELRDKLETWFSRYVNPQMDGRCSNVDGAGQVGLFSFNG